jgi:abortive infection bacteriophage resistance protein
MKFTKLPLSIDDKIALLQQRGLQIPNSEKAKKYLNHIGYFRLTGYFKRYQDSTTNQFRKGTTFDQVIDLYIFDRKLRLLTLDAIEKIEVSVKSQIDSKMSTKYGCFWYTDSSLFTLKNKVFIEMYQHFIENITITKEKSNLLFVKAYNEKYDEEQFLPSRMMFESCTIGSMSAILTLLNREDTKDIAKTYSTSYKDLRKRIQFIVNVRNYSAHHERIWNRDFGVRVRKNDVVFQKKYTLEETQKNSFEVVPNFFNFILIVEYLLQQISPNNDRLQRLEALFNEFPTIPKESM